MKALLALLVVVGSLIARTAAADEVAPALETADLRVDATAALRMLDRRAIPGVYVAFDPNPTDALAQAACDDDGDPVIVVSDAMLRLVAQITRLAQHDRDHQTSTLDGYAAYLVANQAPGKRLLAPPPGTFDAGSSVDAVPREQLVAALLFVLARELEHHRARDLACAHPTLTTEAGDAIWTAGEQIAAVATARSLYPGNASARDEAAAAGLVATSAQGAFDVLAFFARFDAEHAKTPARVVPSYVVTHPRSAARLASVKSIASKKAVAP